MSYMKIPNLYKADAILAFKHGFAMEKVHGTSAHLRYKKSPAVMKDIGGTTVPFEDTPAMDSIDFFSGGASHLQFITLFDRDALFAKFRELTAGDAESDLTIYGEAYGGKMQGMKDTYGPDLKFIAFEVKRGDKWLSPPAAFGVVTSLGLEFVPFEPILFTQEAIDAERDRPSIVAMRRGMGGDKHREGVVLRPPFEVLLNNGSRLIAKHKRPEYCETASKREADPDKAIVLEKADAIAAEWVTKMRLMHILDQLAILGLPVSIQSTGKVIDLMVDDVIAEAKDEIVASKEARKAIGTAAARLFKEFLHERGF